VPGPVPVPVPVPVPSASASACASASASTSASASACATTPTVRLSGCLAVWLSGCLAVWLSACPPVRLSAFPPVQLCSPTWEKGVVTILDQKPQDLREWLAAYHLGAPIVVILHTLSILDAGLASAPITHMGNLEL
jgi:hypothetical protein